MGLDIYNLHNHTPFSDGAYTVDEIIEAHVEFDEFPIHGVGIGDHLFCTPSSREVRGERDFERLFAEETRRYVDEVHAARERWQGRIEVFCGAEINWPLNRHLLDRIKPLLGGIDYVLVEYADWAGLTLLANQARRFGTRIGLAHTDVERQFPNTSMDQVVRTMANARIFYEINSKFLPLGQRDKWFDVLPRHRVQVSLGTDTHDDLGCLRDLGEMARFVEERGLAQKLLRPAVEERVAARAG